MTMAVNFDQIPCVDRRVVGVGKRRVLRRRTVTNDGLDGMRMMTFDGDEVRGSDVVGGVDGMVLGVGKRRVLGWRTMTNDGLDGMRMVTIDVDDVGSGDVVGRVDRRRWFRRRRAMAGEGVDSSSSPTPRPPLRLPLRAARVLASCVMHRLREDAVDGELI